MRPTVVFAILGALAGSLAMADARYIQEMTHGFVIPCEGDLCHQTLFCWRGARFADLNQLATRVRAQVEFDNEKDTCVDAESDDVLSLRALAFGFENETAAVRLSDRIDKERGWISGMILNALLGQHKVTGDGECQGRVCTLYFSPYHSSCIRLCGAPAEDGRKAKADVRFQSEFALDTRSVYMFLIGLAIAAAAPSLSERPEMFYLTGGSLGVMFAVALMVLIASRMATRSGPTKGQLGVAAFMQVGAVFMRKTVYDFVKNYIDWIALYVIVTFVASLALVHYFLKGDDGRIRLSSSLKDIVRMSLQLLGAFFMAAPIPSARMRLFVLATLFVSENISNFHPGGLLGLIFGRIQSRSQGGIPVEEKFAQESEHGARTPQRSQVPRPSISLSGSRYLTEKEYREQGREYTDQEVAKLLTPPPNATKGETRLLDWLRERHTHLFIRSEGEGEEIDEDSGEGEGDDEDLSEEIDDQ